MWSKLECKIGTEHMNLILNFDSQLQVGKGTGEDAYNGMLDCFRKIIRNEGTHIDPLLQILLTMVQDSVDYIVG